MSDLDLSEWYAEVITNYNMRDFPKPGDRLVILERLWNDDLMVEVPGREEPFPLPKGHYRLRPKVAPPDTAAAKLYLKRKKELEKLREEAPEMLAQAVREFRAGIESLQKAGAQVELLPGGDLPHTVWYSVHKGHTRRVSVGVSEKGLFWKVGKGFSTADLLLEIAQECSDIEVPIGA